MATRKILNKILPLGEKLPLNAKGKRVRVFGVTRGAYKNPAFWSVNKIPHLTKNARTGMKIDPINPNSGSVLGHAHSLTLTDPRFDKMYRPGMFDTRGYKVRKGKSYLDKLSESDLELTSRAKRRLEEGLSQNYKNRYAFIDGKVKDIQEMSQMPTEFPLKQGLKYKKGRLQKVDLDTMLNRGNDYYVGQTMRNGTNRQLIGKREYDLLKKHNKLGKGKYHYVKQVRLDPAGQMRYYEQTFLDDVANFEYKPIRQSVLDSYHTGKRRYKGTDYMPYSSTRGSSRATLNDRSQDSYTRLANRIGGSSTAKVHESRNIIDGFNSGNRARNMQKAGINDPDAISRGLLLEDLSSRRYEPRLDTPAKNNIAPRMGPSSPLSAQPKPVPTPIINKRQITPNSRISLSIKNNAPSMPLSAQPPILKMGRRLYNGNRTGRQAVTSIPLMQQGSSVGQIRDFLKSRPPAPVASTAVRSKLGSRLFRMFR
jgi:hypothetical protein